MSVWEGSGNAPRYEAKGGEGRELLAAADLVPITVEVQFDVLAADGESAWAEVQRLLGEKGIDARVTATFDADGERTDEQHSLQQMFRDNYPGGVGEEPS